MACSTRLFFTTQFCKVLQARFLSVQSIKFARGNRLLPTHTTSQIVGGTVGVIEKNSVNCETSFKKESVFSELKSNVINLTENECMQEDEEDTKNAARVLPNTLPYFEKLGDNDKRFSTLMMTMRSKKDRSRRNEIALEGRRLIEDALNAGLKIRSVFFSNKDTLKLLRIPKDINVEFFKIQYKQLQLWSTLTTSAGIVGIFDMPKQQHLETLKNNNDKCLLPLTLICDNLREPGNLGAIMRVAAGVGCKQILLTKGCVDLWDSKVLRSAAGAHFRIPVIPRMDWDDLKRLLKKEQATVFVADSSGNARNKKLIAQDYCDVDVSSVEPMVLILGGETEGLSEDAQNLSTCRLHIPLEGGVESLNVASALAVILFEMRRQRYAIKEYSRNSGEIKQ